MQILNNAVLVGLTPYDGRNSSRCKGQIHPEHKRPLGDPRDLRPVQHKTGYVELFSPKRKSV